MAVSRKWRNLSLASLALVMSLAAGALATVGAAAPAAAQTTSNPACDFNGSSLGLVTGVTEGGTVQIDCTGLPDSTPYLVMEVSLVIALDPNTAALLSGTVSPSLLIGALDALPIINPAALDVTTSDSSGNLDYAYKTPTTQPVSSDADCPPDQEEYNSGLIGCAIALVNLETADELAAGSALLEYQGFPLFPPDGTVAYSPSSGPKGTTVNVSDAPGATTYWWLATLAALEGDLGGSSAPPGVLKVKMKKIGKIPSSVTVTPASYNGSTFTPPVLSGTFTVPKEKAGTYNTQVDYSANLAGLDLVIDATAPFTITKGAT
jgi:hypothetical protein